MTLGKCYPKLESMENIAAPSVAQEAVALIEEGVSTLLAAIAVLETLLAVASSSL